MTSLSVVLALLGLFCVLSLVMPVAMLRIPRSFRRDDGLPRVSVLVAARNEERDLPRCIAALAALDYPADRLEVLLVDDRSTDGTAAVIARACAGSRIFSALSTREPSELSAKARGIALAARRATGRWLFITDADCAVHPQWVRHMLSRAKDDTGLLGGTYMIEPAGWLGAIEAAVVAYLMPFAMGLVGLGARPIVSGPNMAIRCDVYLAGGGLEAARCAVAEDLALTRIVQEAGLGVVTYADAETTAWVRPVPSAAHLVSQQRRWLLGSRDMPEMFWPVNVLLGLQAVLFASLWALALQSPRVAAVGWACATLVNAWSLCILGWRVRARVVGLLPLLLLYQALVWPPIWVSTVLWPRTWWRGEGYSTRMPSPREPAATRASFDSSLQ